MQQNHPDSTIPDSKLMNYKHQRCEYIQEPQIYKQLSAILPTFLTDPSSRANTFNHSLVSSLTWAFPQAMLHDANCNEFGWLLAQRKKSVTSPIFLPQTDLLFYLHISGILWHNLPSSSFITSSLHSDLLCSSLLPTPKICRSKTCLLAF